MSALLRQSVAFSSKLQPESGEDALIRGRVVFGHPKGSKYPARRVHSAQTELFINKCLFRHVRINATDTHKHTYFIIDFYYYCSENCPQSILEFTLNVSLSA